MPLTLQDLKSHLWNCAQILRGSPVDRTDWKAYILPLLFLKQERRMMMYLICLVGAG